MRTFASVKQRPMSEKRRFHYVLTGITLMFIGLQLRGARVETGDVNFIVLSDIGAYGGGDQIQVANTVAEFAEDFPTTAILDLGDTFHYWGVQSADDPGWWSNFENIYTAHPFHNLWYAVLGNHEYQGNTQAEIDYTHKSRRWNLPAHYYTQTFKKRGTTVDLIFLDTTPFLRRARSQPEIYPDACKQDTAAQKRWLEQQLAASEADWVIVAAHHPLYSARPDNSYQRVDVRTHLDPVLATRRPDLYINGDVHCFEHLQVAGDPTDYMTCTSGSVAYPVNGKENNLFADGRSGFCTITADKNSLTFTMLDNRGNILYTYTKTK